MPLKTEDEHQAADAGSPSPIEHEAAFDQSPNEQPATPNDPSLSTAKEPGDAGPTFLSRLSHLPIQRSLPWRAGQELPPERSSDSERVQQRGASLLATRGDISAESCTACAAGRGRFEHCITLGNWFQGACSSCVFTSRGNRCSLRLQRGKVDGRSARHQPVEEGGMNENPRPTKRRRQTSEREPTIASAVNEPLVQDNPATRPRAELAYVNANGLPSHSHDMEERQKKKPKLPSGFQDHAQRPVALPQTAVKYSEPLLRAEMAHANANGLPSHVHDVEERQKKSPNLPSEFQDHVPRYQEPPIDFHVVRGNSAFTPVNGTARSLSAGSRVQPKAWPPMASRDIRVGAPVQSPKDGERPRPLIDSLPRSKQRQIFGLIGGIQGGIDHLQKQLRSLQASLGMEFEPTAEKKG